jgi:CRP-like cAMP-binding protein
MQVTAAGDLSDCRILAGLPETQMALLQNNAEWRSYGEGEQFFRQGDAGTDMMFLLEGRARVLIHAASGQDVAFSEIGPGGHFGELSTLDGGSRSASVVAIQSSMVAVVGRDAILQAMSAFPPFALNLLQDCARLLRRSNERVVGLSTKSGIQRVYDEILRLVEPSPMGDGSWLIPNIPAHKDIAIWSGTTTETVARAIGQLTSIGIVKRRNRTLQILDRRHIEKLANTGVEEQF